MEGARHLQIVRTGKIHLFITDIDGCLAEPFQPYRLDRFQLLAAYAARAAGGDDPHYPAVSICSGRACAYVEAVTQALGLRVPVAFESGGGLFDPVEASVTWNPAFDDETAAALASVRRWMLRDALPGTSLAFDFGKRTQAGIIGPDRDEVAALTPRVEQHVAATSDRLCVFHTPYSIDVVPQGITKLQALQWLSRVLDVDLDAMAYVGDSNGDLAALEAVGQSFAPANADETVRHRVDRVTQGAMIEGVIEAYEACVTSNAQAAGRGTG